MPAKISVSNTDTYAERKTMFHMHCYNYINKFIYNGLAVCRAENERSAISFKNHPYYRKKQA